MGGKGWAETAAVGGDSSEVVPAARAGGLIFMVRAC